MHISDSNERYWLMKNFEELAFEVTPKEEKMKVLEELAKSQCFNSFLNEKLKTFKRFGVEGLDSMISGLSKIWAYLR